MTFTFRLWIFTLEIKLFDLDPSDGDIEFSVRIAWK